MEHTTLARIEISKEYLKFSAGHFTLFSASERENLHGHNYQVSCSVITRVGADGLAFDYTLIKKLLLKLCNQLDEFVLLPERSPYLRIESVGGRISVWFADECIPFLERDVLLLPIPNVTIEELAWLLLRRLRGFPELTVQPLESIELGVSSGPGQWAYAVWERPRESQP
jgi:6-pyruvoyltetrahydropterin/6-carboxytetrahydropterin synthase